MTKTSRNKQIIKISAVLLTSIIANPAPAQAQTLSCPQSLLFGNYTTCASSQSATISPNNVRTTTGCLSAGGAPFSRARCIVTQTFPLKNIVFTITATTAKLNHTTAAASMTVNNFKCMTSSVKCTSASPVKSATFFLSIPIGATMNVGNPQTSGSYTGTFTVNAILQ